MWLTCTHTDRQTNRHTHTHTCSLLLLDFIGLNKVTFLAIWARFFSSDIRYAWLIELLSLPMHYKTKSCQTKPSKIYFQVFLVFDPFYGQNLPNWPWLIWVYAVLVSVHMGKGLAVNVDLQNWPLRPYLLGHNIIIIWGPWYLMQLFGITRLGGAS